MVLPIRTRFWNWLFERRNLTIAQDMSDQSNPNQASEETPIVVDDNNMDQLITELDAAITETDPEFLNKINSIQVDNQYLEAMANSGVDFIAVVPESVSIKQRLFQLIDFKHNFKTVFMFWLSVIGVGVLVTAVIKFGPWHTRKYPFLMSYSEWGVPVEDYNPLSETQLFFENPKTAKNLVELKKMMVNIKPSQNSGPNPMLAFTVSIEGVSKEVVVEIKDREAEFLDMSQRLAEEFTYDELSGTEGKQELSSKILDAANSVLTSGQARKVYYSSFIIKP